MNNSHLSQRLDMESYLERQFCLHFSRSVQSNFPYSLAQLLQDETALRHLLSEQQRLLGNPSSVVVGSLFAKRLSAWGMGILTSISLFDTRISLNPADIRIRVLPEAIMHYHVKWSSETDVLPDTYPHRSQVIGAEFERLIALCRDVISRVSACTGTPIRLMWSLLSHNWQTLYLHIPQVEPLLDVARLTKIDQDRRLLLHSGTDQPLAIELRRLSHDLATSPPSLLRRHCCLAYQLEPERSEPDYCTTCPKAVAGN